VDVRPAIRLPRGRALAVDLLLAALALALSIGMLASGRFEDDARDLDGLGAALAAMTALPLVARRSAPIPVLIATTLPTAALYGLDYSLGPPVGSLVAMYTVAAAGLVEGRTRRTVIAVIAVPLVIVAVVHIVDERGLPFPDLLLGIVTYGCAWLLGDRARHREQRIAELEERAVRAEREAERERRLAAAEERTRIARDLHDSAGHAINVILVQAGAARLLQDREPDRAKEALHTIEEVARETIGEIDRMVHALRAGEAAGDPRIEPAPGLAALDTLAERHRSAGLEVEVQVAGAGRPLPPGTDQAAYRIVQEALTNAALHGAGTARVELTHGADGIEILVTNPTRGDGAAREGGGLGIVGMRERAALLGGRLEAGTEDGTFAVRARLPVGAGPS
jgi:signal transduction histidine kinase